MLRSTYFAQNYAGIIRQGLLIGQFACVNLVYQILNYALLL